MRSWRLALISGGMATLAGCIYVTDAQFKKDADADSDGWYIGDGPNDPQADCAPNDANVFPGAPDVRGDGCDADCGFETDSDGDDWPDEADCNPSDSTIFPWSPYEKTGDGVDSDCDGDDGIRRDAPKVQDPAYPDDTNQHVFTSTSCPHPAVPQ